MCVCVGGGGGGEGGECVWVVKMQTCRGGGRSGGILPRGNFRNFGLPWTTFRAFSWSRKTERDL